MLMIELSQFWDAYTPSQKLKYLLVLGVPSPSAVQTLGCNFPIPNSDHVTVCLSSSDIKATKACL